MYKGNENWFEKLRGLRNRGFEKSGFYCIFSRLALAVHFPTLGAGLHIFGSCSDWLIVSFAFAVIGHI